MFLSNVFRCDDPRRRAVGRQMQTDDAVENYISALDYVITYDGSGSFLKNRTKKLLFPGGALPKRTATAR